MDDTGFHKKLAELLEKLQSLPEGANQDLTEVAQKTKDRREQIRTSVAELQESLDYLRLSVKYLVFDLEATRRENSYLRKMIEQSNREQQRRDQQDDEEM